MQETANRWTPYAVLVIGALLFVDFFLGWHRASVSVVGIVHVHGDSSAWAGWGAVAGICLIVLLLWEGLRLAGAVVAQETTGAVVCFGLALGTVAFTAIEFFTGSASVQSTSSVVVDVHGRQWPAYAGIVLALLLLAAAVMQLGRPAERHPGRLGLGVR
jgi:uncharacterized membrane protein